MNLAERRRGLRWLPFLVFTSTTFLFLALPLLGLRTYAGVDLIELGAPYRNVLGRPPEVKSPIQTDQVEGFPGPIAFRRELNKGNWQLWDVNIAGGTPTAPFTHVIRVFSPFGLGYLLFPAWYAIGLQVALTYLFCQWFTYLLLRRLGVSVGPATATGVAYAFAGTNIVLTHRVTAQMVLPAILWAVHRLIGKPSFGAAALTAVFVAWSWFEGFPAGFVYCMYVAVAWAMWLVTRELLMVRSWRDFRLGLRTVLRRLFTVAGAMLWGLALAAFSLLPLVSEVKARGLLEERNYTSATHLPGIQLFGIFELSAQGRYPEGDWWSGLNPVESITHSGLIVALAVFVGLLVAASGRLRLSRDGTTAWSFFCALGIVSVCLNFFGTPLLGFVYRLPGIANNPINRSRFTINLAMVILGALAFDGWLQADAPSRVRAPRAMSLITLVLGLATVGAVLPDWLRAAEDASAVREVGAGLAKGAGVAVAASLLALLAVRRPRWTGFAFLSICGLLFAQLAYPLRNFTPAAPIRDFYSRQRGHVELQRLLGTRFRFTASGLFNFYPNSSQVFRTPDLRGLAFPSRRFKKLIRAINPTAFDRDPLKIILFREEWNLSSPLLDDLAVRFFVLGTDEMPFGVTTEADQGWEAWVPASELGPEALTFRASGPIVGMGVPLRGNSDCSRTRVTVNLLVEGRNVSSSSRPGFDLTETWLFFALDGEDLRAGDRYQLSLVTGSPRCQLEVGVISWDGRVRPARTVLGPDPSLPVKLVSTEQAWIYERPSAWPLVSAHIRWRGFKSQEEALAFAATRPPAEGDVVSFVGEGPPTTVGALPAQTRVAKWGGDEVKFDTKGSADSLVVVSQNHDPGWEVEIDGRKSSAVRVDGVLAGVFVPPGRHTVRLIYRPASFRIGSVLTIAGLALLVLFPLAYLMTFRSKTKVRPQPAP